MSNLPERDSTHASIFQSPHGEIPDINQQIKQSILFFFFLATPLSIWGILVPCTGIKPSPPTLEMWNLNHWTTRGIRKTEHLNKD